MSRRSKIALGLVAVLAVLLAINTITVGAETKPAELTVDGAELAELSDATVQVLDRGPLADLTEPTAPIVLIHCFTCSMRWWDALAPELEQTHRVIRVDLLGHGGSEKPTSGYEISTQASLVAQVLAERGVEGAVVVGHSLGGAVATALAENSSQLVDRVVIIDTPPTEEAKRGFSLTARLAMSPVIGEALWRFTPDFVMRKSIEDEAFGDGFDTADGFDDPDQPLHDLRALNYSAFDDAPAAFDDYLAELGLPQRIDAAAIPATAIFGADDVLIDVAAAREAWQLAPAASVEVIEGAGHSPNVEAPEQTAALILEAADAAAPPPPEPKPKAKPKRGGKGKAGRRSQQRKQRD